MGAGGGIAYAGAFADSRDLAFLGTMWVVFTAARIAVASLIVGAILMAFDISVDSLLGFVGLTPEWVRRTAEMSLAWAQPRIELGAIIVVPVFVLAYLFRPPSE